MKSYVKKHLLTVICMSSFFSASLCAAEIDSAKISPLCRHMFLTRQTRSGKRGVNGSQQFINVLIKTDYPEKIRNTGAFLTSYAGNIACAMVPVHALGTLAQKEWVHSIEAAALCRPLLDESVPAIGADAVHNGTYASGSGNLAYTGKNVIVGVVDYGIDWTHEDFITEEGASRILYLWDQTEEGGTAPEEGYGSEYTARQITDAITGTGLNVAGKDIAGHGTHVAGIAAGNGRASGNNLPNRVYTGVAPQADLIIVKIADSGVAPQNRICDAASYIFRKAEEEGKPAVVNISFGTQKGPHNGTSEYEQYMDNLVSGKKGRAIVSAAGNDGIRPIHFLNSLSATADDSAVYKIYVDCISENVEDYVSLDIWSLDYTDLELYITSPKNERIGPFNSSGDFRFDTNSGTVYVTIAQPETSPNESEMIVTLSDTHTDQGFEDNLSGGNWTLTFFGRAGDFHGWIYDTSAMAVLAENASYETLVAEPGNSMFTISVGSFVSRTQWPSLFQDPWGPGNITFGDISQSSSPGPSRSNAQRPIIAAPGEWIVSSLSSFRQTEPSDNLKATDSVHVAQKGTSMAAPHVAGTIALLFEKDNNLSVSQIKTALIYSANSDMLEGEYWDEKWGFGMLDAAAAIQEIESGVSEQVHVPQSFTVSEPYPNPFNSTVSFNVSIPAELTGSDAPKRIAIYSVLGKPVYSKLITIDNSGICTATWNGTDMNDTPVSSGIYIYKISVSDVAATGKVILTK